MNDDRTAWADRNALAAAVFDVAIGVVIGTAATAGVTLISGGGVEWQGFALAGVFSGFMVVAARRHGWSFATYLRRLRDPVKQSPPSRGDAEGQK